MNIYPAAFAGLPAPSPSPPHGAVPSPVDLGPGPRQASIPVAIGLTTARRHPRRRQESAGTGRRAVAAAPGPTVAVAAPGPAFGEGWVRRWESLERGDHDGKGERGLGMGAHMWVGWRKEEGKRSAGGLKRG
jgi:hypothetical protein